MIRVFVERSLEAPALAGAEAAAAAEAVGGRPGPAPRTPSDLVALDVPDRAAAIELAGRLALARRCLVRLAGPGEVAAQLAIEGRSGAGAAVRRIGHATGGGRDPGVGAAGAAYRSGGGRIDLDDPARRFWLVADDGGDALFEEIAPVDRSGPGRRRMPTLPFQRPVGLPPRLARAAVNLARVRPGDRVVDPFVGTAALLAEAGLLGARLVGIDVDPAMVRGALRNLAHLGLSAEELHVGDAGTIETGALPCDAVITDPPYGRSSSTGGAVAAELVARVLPRWADRVRDGGRVVVIFPGGYEPLGPPWTPVVSVPVRVHRSLTRTFRAYARAP
ncbi:MAG TPA: hypothetical protein VMG99_05565 [Thermoplasmata archaeon]|nr:hypothetical protein [Thermoplasmata archaeon]